jgi:hypothetical protein
MALDLLGTHLSDTPPFGGMILSAPMEFMSKVMLCLQPDVWVDVQPAEESDGPAASP